ncbi:uncharacterized protein LOC142576415 [Dermacentor variabilis]|uniref:uncharacterized protein LOC142576415 n=1 Tax=Dermacentor variabilis TaxID=34621 RepID=UPI003F5C6141
MMALIVASLLLVSLAAMARSNRVMAAASAVGRLNVNNRKPELVMSSADARVTVLAPDLVVRSPKAKTTSGRIAGMLNETSPRRTEEDVERTTVADEAATRHVAAGNERARKDKPLKQSDVLEAPADDYGNVEVGESSEDLMAFPFQRPTRPMCGDVFYTVCHPSSQREFHFRRSVNACVETAADAVHTCNRGANRFASMTHCRQSCMRGGHRPAEECFGKPLFTSCARQDVLSSWWFFEGRKCVPWNFPSGGCPADDSAVFRSAQECRAQCVVGGLGRSPCRPPRSVACEGRHLKYPFFADLSATDGRMRCLRSSPDVLRDRRCLTGANRFRTREACVGACKNRPTG